jgi:hypothetical protein
MANQSPHQGIGQQVASPFSPRSTLLGSTLERINFRLSFMKKTSRHDHPSELSHRSRRDCRQNGGSEGRWEFITCGSIFAIGSNGTARRAAYRSADGELRFLPL